MPPVLEAPQLRPPRQRRKPTWTHRIVVTFMRLVILGVILGVGGGGYYLAKRGFGRQWRDRVVEELRKHGVEANIGRLTLDPFRGLVAKNVRIFDYKNHENILALISEVSLDINYAALIHHEPFLNALDVRDAQIILPFKTADEKGDRAALTNLRAHVYFPPEQIYVSQAEGIFCGVRISATGQLIKRNDYKPSDAISEEELRQRLLLVHRVADELRRFTFPGEGPSLQIKFAGDLSQFETIHAEAALSGERLRRGDYEMSNLSVAADWANHTLQIKQCTWSDSIGNFSGRASWNLRTKAVDFQGRSTLDAKRFLDAAGFPLLADVTLNSPPLLELSGSADFAPDTPKISVIGRVDVERFSYKTIPLLK